MIKIVLADDHAVVRAGIRQFLEQAADMTVVAEAEDGAQAKELIVTHQPDVVVLDIQMPEITGVELTRWLQTTYPDIKILILTAFDDEPYIVAVLQAGADGYVLKTSSPERLTEAVRQVYSGQSALAPEITTNLMAHLVQQRSEPEFEPLTERELEVLTFAGTGLTNKEIGLKLGISDRTVQGHLAKSFSKLRANSRTKAVMRAVSLGLIDADLVS